jgi:pyruvate dehydrogenase E2 component (dihydrolipoamide acetyltransferase)
MAKEIRMPRMGITMKEGVLVEWLVSEGATIRRGMVIAQIETDKAVQELESPVSGVLARILVPAGSRVPVDTVLALLD